MCVCVCVCVCVALAVCVCVCATPLYTNATHTSPECFGQGSYTTSSAYCGMETSHVGRGVSVYGGGPPDAIAIVLVFVVHVLLLI